MWELDYKESWALKNWCFWTVVLEKTLESPLDCKKMKTISPKGNQFWIFIGRTDVEVDVPILWPPEMKSWLIRKDPDVGKDWRQEEKGITEDEVVGYAWVWASSKRWWRTVNPGVLQSTGSQSHIWLSNWKATIRVQGSYYREASREYHLMGCCCLVAKPCPALLWPHGP